jgi:hypothetical protein
MFEAPRSDMCQSLFGLKISEGAAEPFAECAEIIAETMHNSCKRRDLGPRQGKDALAVDLCRG